MTRSSVFATAALMSGLAALTGCWKEEEAAAPRTSITNVAETGAPGTGMAHGNHDPKFGGVVLMNGTLHFEVVAGEDGRCTLYFSDEARRELPASVVSGLKLYIERNGIRPEGVDMKIDSDGASWSGKGSYVDDKGATLRISFDYQGERRTSDMPYFAAELQKAASR